MFYRCDYFVGNIQHVGQVLVFVSANTGTSGNDSVTDNFKCRNKNQVINAY
jgi:hypothetical protein